ncbi:MAG: hypothetical protein Q7I94_01280 [Candidatus Contubernalis sp.]|nr:hypothetical protein [Candidatus Contubernalis sp.]
MVFTDLKPEDFLNDPQWQSVEAVKNERVYMLPDPYYCDLWTVKYQFSVKSVSHWLYPDKFPDMNLEKEGLDMLKFLYNHDFSS